MDDRQLLGISDKKRVLTVASSRLIDKLAVEKYGMSSLLLMENAGRGLTDFLCQFQPKNVVVCAGKGNNGGDGFVIARHLNCRNIPVSVFALDELSRYRGDAHDNLQILENLSIPVSYIESENPNFFLLKQALSQTDWIVDSLLGTGVNGELREPLRSILQIIGQSGKKVFSVDIPSGLNADTGESYGPAICASATGTMVAWKRGLALAPISVTGQVAVIDLGINLPEVSQLLELL